jgi:N-acetylglutamate synthase-like GNAT family acetyltransferase
MLDRLSLGRVIAREGDRLVGFVNVVWDGHAHAWVQDTMVPTGARHDGVGTAILNLVQAQCRQSGCQWLHVDFEAALQPFYLAACGFAPTAAGLLEL